MADKADHHIREIADAPLDSISAVRFSPKNPQGLIASSWDTSLYYYDTQANERRSKFDHRAAVLDCCFSSDGKRAFSGGLDMTVREFDLESQLARSLGQHDNAVSSMAFASSTNNLISGSWDRTVRFWDPRSANAQVASFNVRERVYKLDVTGNTMVVAMAGRLFDVYDVRKTSGRPTQEREGSLKFLTRSMGCMPDGQGYAAGSVEGRISVEYFDESPEVQEKKYAFKCHRQAVDGEDLVWAVNSIAFHPIFGTFASAGSDGTVSIWDHKSRKRLRQYPKLRAAIPSISWSCDGRQLAIAESYNWDEGREGMVNAPRPRILVREVGDEVKPKGWTG